MPDVAAGAALLDVDGLVVAFPGRAGAKHAVNGLTYAIQAGRTLGVVGESGCGKTVAALALMRLVPPPGRIKAGAIAVDGIDVMTLDEPGLRDLRGQRVAMVFQDPAAALNPVMTIGAQVAESYLLHRQMNEAEAMEAAIGMLERVGIPDPRRRAGSYPHQLSGGMRQRAMIAMALACRPALLIADEPTTALDATIQAQILDLMQELQDETDTSIQFISHNLGVVASVAHDVMVMYAGRDVETGPAEDVLRRPLHPYTQALIETLPRLGARRDRLPAIAGAVPRPGDAASGCRFAERCPRADARCRAADPPLEDKGGGRRAACFKA